MKLKKLTQKDRYGNMISYEFEVPPMQEIPHPGGPRGTDTVPAWLTPGERVMNAEAERLYGPALEEMNEHGRAIQRAQGGTIPEYAACGSKMKYKSAGGPVYAQQGISPEQMSVLLANQVLSGALDPRIAEAALSNQGMGQGQAQAVIPSYTPNTQEDLGIPFVPSEVDDGMESAAPVSAPVREIPDTIAMGRPYPEVPQVPGTLNAEPPQKVDDRMVSLRSLLLKHEDIKNKPYKDSEGHWTVGVGHKITDKEVIKQLDRGTMPINYDDNQVMGLFDKDIETAVKGAKQNFSGFNSYSNNLQDALVSMNFQLGTEGTRKFEDFRAALAEGNYEKAKAELDNSDWAKQTPTRVEHLKSVIDQEASGRVGNKNTITSTSGQPVVDSRFGVESTYKGQDTSTAVPPVVNEIPFVPSEVDEGVNNAILKEIKVPYYEDQALRSLRGQEPEKDILGNAIDSAREFVFGDKDHRFDLSFSDNFVGDEINYLNEAPQRPTGYGPSKEKEEWDRRYGQTHYENGRPKDPNLTSESFGDEVQEGLASVAPEKPVPLVEGGRGNIIEKPGARVEEATPLSPKAEAAKTIQKQTQNQVDPTLDDADANSIIKYGEQQSPEAKSKAQSFFEEWGLADLFDKKEIGRMVALYLGSRALGHSHGGSLNFAAKNYAERVQSKTAAATAAQAKRAEKVVQMVADGKISPKAAEMYKRTGNLAYLDSTLKGGTPQGNFEEFFSPTGKKVRAQKFKMPDGSIVYKTKDGLQIDESYNQDRSRQKGTDEYQARYDKAVKNSKELFDERFNLMGGNEDGASEWTQNLRVGPKKAAEEFWAWAESSNIDPDSPEARSIMGQAYEQALADAKGGKVKVPSLKPYLEAQHYRETTGTTELWVINPEQVAEDDAMPRYVRQDKMNELFSQADIVARNVLPKLSSQNKTVARQRIFKAAQDAWIGLSEPERKSWMDSTEPKAGVSGFYLYLQEQFKQQLIESQAQ